MCFRFDAWCCFSGCGGTDDHDYYGGSSAKGSSVPPHHHGAASAKATATTPHYPPPPQAEHRNGHYHYGHQGAANGHRAPQPHLHHQLPVAAAAYEEDRKASNDARKGYNAPAAGAGAQEKAYVYSDADSKHPATNAKIVDGAPYYYYYHEREPAHRQEYYRYADHEKY